MLYCPKCQRTYEEGAQRFCSDDNARLLQSASSSTTAPFAGNANGGNGVFTGIFDRVAASPAPDKDAASSASNLKEKDASRTFRGAFRPPPTSKIFKPEAKVEQEIEKFAKTQAQIVRSAPPPFDLNPEIPNEKPLEKTDAPTNKSKSFIDDGEHFTEKSTSDTPAANAELQSEAAQTESLTAAASAAVNAVAVSGASTEVVSERAEETVAAAEVKRTSLNEAVLPERRAVSKPTAKVKTNWAIPGLLGAIIVLSSFGLWYFMPRRAAEPQVARNAVSSVNNIAPQPMPETPPLETKQPNGEIELPPRRAITPPENFILFENSKQNLKGDAEKNFLGFSLYYPKDWKKNDAKNNFLDVSKNTSSGTPVEQMLVSFYDSRGTFDEDKEIFPALIKDTKAMLKKIVPKFKPVSKGETTINGGWRAYEFNFVGAGKTAKGEDIKLWGRRLFVPAQRGGVKNGYVLTLLATSFSPDVKSVEDVGVKGDLSRVLETFEPSRDF